MLTLVGGEQDPFGREAEQNWYDSRFFDITRHLGNLLITDIRHPSYSVYTDSQSGHIEQAVAYSPVDKSTS